MKKLDLKDIQIENCCELTKSALKILAVSGGQLPGLPERTPPIMTRPFPYGLYFNRSFMLEFTLEEYQIRMEQFKKTIELDEKLNLDFDFSDLV